MHTSSLCHTHTRQSNKTQSVTHVSRPVRASAVSARQATLTASHTQGSRHTNCVTRIHAKQGRGRGGATCCGREHHCTAQRIRDAGYSCDIRCVILDAPSRCQALDQTPVRHPVRHAYSGHKHHLTQVTQVAGTWWQGCGECSLRLVHELKLRCISYVSLLSLLCLAHMCLCERACAHMHQREWHTLALLQV